MTEDYVSFESAKLLKEKGFDEKCRALYTVWFDEEVEGPTEDRAENWNIEPRYFSAPTLQMAMKWLREKYSLEIYPYHNFNSKWWYEIIKCPNSVAEHECGKDEELDTYEQACKAAIKYCLENLI